MLCSLIVNSINKIGSNCNSRSASFFGDELKSTYVFSTFLLLKYENANIVFFLYKHSNDDLQCTPFVMSQVIRIEVEVGSCKC